MEWYDTCGAELLHKIDGFFHNVVSPLIFKKWVGQRQESSEIQRMKFIHNGVQFHCNAERIVSCCFYQKKTRDIFEYIVTR